MRTLVNGFKPNPNSMFQFYFPKDHSKINQPTPKRSEQRKARKAAIIAGQSSWRNRP